MIARLEDIERKQQDISAARIMAQSFAMAAAFDPVVLARPDRSLLPIEWPGNQPGEYQNGEWIPKDRHRIADELRATFSNLCTTLESDVLLSMDFIGRCRMIRDALIQSENAAREEIQYNSCLLDGARAAILPYQEYLRSQWWRWRRARALGLSGKCADCGGQENLVVHHRIGVGWTGYEGLGCEWDDELSVLCRLDHQAEHIRIDADTERCGWRRW